MKDNFDKLVNKVKEIIAKESLLKSLKSNKSNFKKSDITVTKDKYNDVLKILGKYPKIKDIEDIYLQGNDLYVDGDFSDISFTDMTNYDIAMVTPSAKPNHMILLFEVDPNKQNKIINLMKEKH